MSPFGLPSAGYPASARWHVFRSPVSHFRSLLSIPLVRAAALALALLASPALLINHASAGTTWNGNAAQTTGNWGAAANWEGALPTFNAEADLLFRNFSTNNRTTSVLNTAQIVRSLTFNSNVNSGFIIKFTTTSNASARNMTMGNATNAAAITVDSGAVGDIGLGQVSNASTTGNLILANNLTVTQSSTGANLTIAAPIIESGGSYGLTKNGSGTLTITKTNTYTGTTTINAGNLTLSGGSAIVNNGTISLADTAGAILHVAASETIGSLQGGGTTGGNVSIAASQTLTVDETGTNTFGGVILGSGALTKSGAGTLTLSNTNTYNGTTTLNAGTLAVSGNIASSGLVINSGGIISPGSSAAVDTFGTSSITINGGGYNWSLSSANGSAGTGYDQITSTGALTSSGVLTVNVYGTPGDWDGSANYSWDIFSANSVTGFSSGNFAIDFTNFGIAAGNRTGTFAFSNPSGGIIQLTYTAASDPVWAGGTGNWDTGFTPSVDNGENIAFSGAGGTATNNISTGTLTTVGDIEFRSGAGAYTLAANGGSAGASGGTALTVTGSITNNSTATQTLNTDLDFVATRTIAANTGNITIGGAISGAGGLTKNGSNKVTLTAANTYTGDTTINTGTLQIGDGSTSGSLSSSSAITNNADLVFNRSNDLTVSNTIGGTGNLTQNGSGTLTLSGSSNYTGTTTISAGTIQIDHANALGSGGNITFSGGGLKYGTGITQDLSSRIKNSGSAILVDTNGESVTWGTNLASTNTGGLTKNGTGTLRINVQSAYSGATAINGGTLQIHNTAGSTAWNPGVIAINNASTLEFTGTLQTIFQDAADTITFDSGGGGSMIMTKNLIWRNSYIVTTGGALNTISGTHFNNQGGTGYDIYYDTAVGSGAVALEVSSDNQLGIRKYGLGTLVLTNSANTMGDSTVINAGTLEIGGAGRLQSGSYSYSITNSGAFSYNSTANQTLSGVISGAGALTKSNSSTLTLSGNNTYSGTTTISAGTIEIGAAGRLGAGSYAQNISNNGTLIYSGTNDQTLSGILSGTGALTKNAASTLTLSGDNTYSGATTINAGTLEIGNGLTAGSLNAASAITVNGALAFNRSDDITQGTHFSTAAIGGTGSIVQNGSGTLTLNAANTYSGGTTLNTGTLVIGNTAAAGTGTITQTDATSVLKFDTTGTITNAMSVYNVLATQSATLSGAITVNNATWDIDTGDTLTVSGAVSGSGGVTKNGGGTLILSGSNSYNGSTVINAGTLNAANANALGSNNTVEVNGGTLLVSTDDAINGKNITLNGTSTTVAGLAFSGNYSGLVNNLTLSNNSIIDLGDGSVSIMFDTIVMSTYMLDIYNWTGTTLWGGGTGNDTDKVYFGPDLSDAALAKIRFHSGAVGVGDSFLGSGYDLGLQVTSFNAGLSGYHIIPVPEPETWATGILLLLGGGIWMWRKRRVGAGAGAALCDRRNRLPPTIIDRRDKFQKQTIFGITDAVGLFFKK
jgi:fibronectin-binding autotransporter adhesin